MEMKQCSNGHFYDQSKFSDCPYCNSEAANANVTRPLEAGTVGETIPVAQSGGVGSTYSVNRNAGDASAEGHTVALIKKEIGIDPVVGWLVCIEGKEKGKDHRIHSDNNFIGRSEKMDICIRGDDSISRENQAIVTYDTRDRIYYFSPGEGRSVVRLNGKALFSTTQIFRNDVVEIGSTKLMFIPLCGEEFAWK